MFPIIIRVFFFLILLESVVYIVHIVIDTIVQIMDNDLVLLELQAN